MKYRYKGYEIEILRRETGSHEYVLSKKGRRLERAHASAFPGYTAEQALAAAKRRVDKKTAKKKKPATQRRLPKMEVFDVEAVELAIKKLPLRMRVKIFPAARKLADRLEQPPVIVRREMEKLDLVEPMGQGFWGLSKLGTRYYVIHRQRLEEALAKDLGFELEKKQRPNKKKNPIRKKGVFPKYLLQAGYDTVWNYRGWTIGITQRSNTEWAWKGRHPTLKVGPIMARGQRIIMDKHAYLGELTGPTGETEQDALWIAKYWVDKYELFWAMWHKNRDDAEKLMTAIGMLENTADKLVLRKKLSRANLAREWQRLNPKQSGLSSKGAIAWQYFETLPSKERLGIMDEVNEYTKRASWWEILPTAEQRRRGGGQANPKGKRRPNTMLTKEKAKYLMRSGGRRVWQYGKDWEFHTFKDSPVEWEAEVVGSDPRKPGLGHTAGKTEQDALATAKYRVDQEAFLHKIKPATRRMRLREIIIILEQLANDRASADETPRRSDVARELQTRMTDAQGRAFGSISVKERTELIDEVIEDVKVGWHLNPKKPPAKAKAKKNPKASRQKSIAAGFLMGVGR